MDALKQTLHTITNSKLPATAVAFGVRLLLLADDQGGSCRITWDTAQTMADVSSGSVRRYLTLLKNTGALHYSTNAEIYVNFVAYPGAQISPSARGISPSARTISLGANEQINGNGQISPSARGISPSARTISLGEKIPPTPPIGMFVVNSLSETEGTNQLGESDPETLALLTDPDVGISAEIAEQISAQFPKDLIAKQIFTWMGEREKKNLGAGALVNRITRNWAPGKMISEDMERQFYVRHQETLAPLFVGIGPAAPAEAWSELVGD